MQWPDGVEADIDAALAVRNNGEYERAERMYEALLERVPTTFPGPRAFILNELAYVCRSQERHADEARRLLQGIGKAS